MGFETFAYFHSRTPEIFAATDQKLLLGVFNGRDLEGRGRGGGGGGHCQSTDSDHPALMPQH